MNMKKLFLFLALVAFVADVAAQDYKYKDVPFTAVHFSDSYLLPRIEACHDVTIPYAFKMCEEMGRINNFEVAAGRKGGEFRGEFPFDDSDVFKILEGASYLLAVQKDEKLDAYLDDLAQLISEAQEPDGYLYTNRTIGGKLHPWAGEKRWEKDWDLSHETYNLGHFFEAASAHYAATGKKNVLNIATKAADLLYKDYVGGQLNIAPGHQVVEMGLVRLYRVTKEPRYLELARYFLETRGRSGRFDAGSDDLWKNGRYWQNHALVRDQREAVGHAVRATYQYCGMADIAALMNDEGYLTAIDAIWENMVGRKYYITGGIGAVPGCEGFGPDYYLPNASAYCETCAAIGNCMFNHRMFMLHGDAKYIDVLERSLYNAVLSGISLSGDHFFYPNPLECGEAGQERSAWFGCSCCPSNLSRFIPSLPGYQYATQTGRLYANLFVDGKAEIEVDGKPVKVSMNTRYPWDGDICMTLTTKGKQQFALCLRVPGWARNEPVPTDLYSYSDYQNGNVVVVKVNGKAVNYTMDKGYAVIDRKWKNGDKVEMVLPMQPRLVKAHDNVEADRGMMAVEMGPIVYCAEQVDNEQPIGEVMIDENTQFDVKYNADLLNGTNVLIGKAKYYFTLDDGTKIDPTTDLVLIPYALRSHRKPCAMHVWLKKK